MTNENQNFDKSFRKNSKKGENKRIWGRRFSKAVAEFNIKHTISTLLSVTKCILIAYPNILRLEKKLTTYLSHNTAPVIILEDGIEKWQVNEVDISEALLEYRKLSIEKCESTMLDTHQEELSINGIFLFDDVSRVHSDSSLEYGFDNDTWRVIIAQLKTKYPVVELPEKTESIISKFAKAGKKNYNECSLITKELSDDEDEITATLKNHLLTCAIKFYSPKLSKKADQLESTFSFSAVYPLMLAFLDETHILTRKGTDETAPSKSEHSDKMIEDGIDDADITVLGLLIEDRAHNQPCYNRISKYFICYGFALSSIYRLVPLSVYYIPRDRNDFSVLLSCYEALCTLQSNPVFCTPGFCTPPLFARLSA
ncbi:hypothetical protein BDC45DRAFT_531094 [Circinella umbellata]|nr:hypothetical protein BDC45DRAFT_531094 [Circinella umbellata]